MIHDPSKTRDPRGRTPDWHEALALEDLAPGTMKTVKRGGHQLVVLRDEDGEVHALDNRCPHEGYPLASGDLKGKALTCCWHNWKFDVRDGSCMLGGEDVRRYETRVTDGRVEVDLADPDPEEQYPGLLRSLHVGIHRHENGRAIRDGVRLLQLGFDPWRLLAEVAVHDARRAEYGTTHALAVAADCGRLLDRYRGVDAMYAIAPALDLCGEANRRLPERPRPAPLAADGDVGAEIRRAVEEEDAERAEGLLRGALEDGATRAEVEGWLLAVLSDHFLDFGHPLIYLVKGRELFAQAGDEHAGEVYASLLYSIVLGTREDTLPYMAPYTERLASIAERLPEVHAFARDDAPFDAAGVRDAVLDGRSGEAFDAVWRALCDGVRAERVAEALVAAAAHRLLRFDPAHERDPLVAETWLWATHRFTFASAVRNAVQGFDSPDALRFLFQAVAFIHSGRPMDLAPEARASLAGRPAALEDVMDAVTSRAPELAVANGLGYLDAGGDLTALRHAVEDLCVRDPLVRPIVVGHAIKTSFAAFEEYAALPSDEDRRVVLAAGLRLLASPLAERRVHQMVGTSIRWVVEGQVPRKLTQ